MALTDRCSILFLARISHVPFLILELKGVCFYSISLLSLFFMYKEIFLGFHSTKNPNGWSCPFVCLFVRSSEKGHDGDENCFFDDLEFVVSQLHFSANRIFKVYLLTNFFLIIS